MEFGIVKLGSTVSPFLNIMVGGKHWAIYFRWNGLEGLKLAIISMVHDISGDDDILYRKEFEMKTPIAILLW